MQSSIIKGEDLTQRERLKLQQEHNNKQIEKWCEDEAREEYTHRAEMLAPVRREGHFILRLWNRGRSRSWRQETHCFWP